jgi:hypothetical protein
MHTYAHNYSHCNHYYDTPNDRSSHDSLYTYDYSYITTISCFNTIISTGMGAATAAGVAAANNHGLFLTNKNNTLTVPDDPIDSGLKPWTVTGVLPDRERKPISFEGKVYVAPLTTVGTCTHSNAKKVYCCLR